jgi:prephenate dehydratase
VDRNACEHPSTRARLDLRVDNFTKINLHIFKNLNFKIDSNILKEKNSENLNIKSVQSHETSIRNKFSFHYHAFFD